MRPPSPQPFLSAEAGAHEADAVIVGVPVDDASSFRGGAGEGPTGIRRFSDSIETYSPRQRRDLSDLRIADLGDAMPDEIDDAVADAPFVAVLGGDHAVTPHVVRVFAGRHESLTVVGFDAHLDLRKQYPGEHACTFRRIVELGARCAVLGVRSGERAEWDDAASILVHHGRSLGLPAAVRRSLGPVYVTVDIDVLDPSEAPGVGNPEPGGVRFTELLDAVLALDGLDVVGFDLVEVAPPLDPSGITQAAAAVLVREMLLRWVAPNARAARRRKRPSNGV